MKKSYFDDNLEILLETDDNQVYPICTDLTMEKNGMEAIRKEHVK